MNMETTFKPADKLSDQTSTTRLAGDWDYARLANDHLIGHYSLIRSADCFYIQLWWNDKTSPMCADAVEAIAWAKRNGGEFLHSRM